MLALEAQAKDALAYVTGPEFAPADCPGYLNDLAQKMRAIPWDTYSNDELNDIAADTMTLLWKIRLALHQKLGKVDSACALQMRDTFHALRDVEDYLGEFAYHEPALDPNKLDFQTQPIPIYDQKAYPPYFIADSAAKTPFHFQAGDIMIARGVSFVSAVISKVSDNRSQYSHVVFLDVDKNTGKTTTIESYIGVGVAQYDIDYALKNENARLLVLRPKNKALGEKAAEMLLAKTLAGNGHGGPIPYDYSMDFNDHSKMSCSETARAAYEWASNGNVILPIYPATIPDYNTKFLSSIDIKPGKTFTPDDLEIDPNFDLILDWRDYRLIRDSRYKDAILNSMMNWIYDLHYNFQGTAESQIAGNVLLPSRSTPLWPLLQKLSGSPDLDSTMPKSLLEGMTVLQQVGTALYGKVKKADDDYISDHGRPMPDDKLAQTIEDLRQQDLSSYIESGYSLFHFGLRPDGLRPEKQPNP